MPSSGMYALTPSTNGRSASVRMTAETALEQAVKAQKGNEGIAVLLLQPRR